MSEAPRRLRWVALEVVATAAIGLVVWDTFQPHPYATDLSVLDFLSPLLVLFGLALAVAGHVLGSRDRSVPTLVAAALAYGTLGWLGWRVLRGLGFMFVPFSVASVAVLVQAFWVAKRRAEPDR